MNVLVTGGAGYIGSVASRVLTKAGHTVTILDNLSHGHRESVEESIPFIEGNVGDLDQLLPENMAIDAVIHLGAFISAGESMTHPDKYWENNVVQTSRMLAALRKRHIQKLIFASTAAVYGNPTSLPINEDTATKPTNVYGATKLAMDHAITIETESYGLGATSLRFFNVAGAYEGAGEMHPSETHLIPLALAAAAGDRPALPLFGTDYPTTDGTCVRDYIHVADLADAMLCALEHTIPGEHHIYNLGNGAGFSNREVLDTIAKVTGKAVPIIESKRRDGDPAILVASSDKALRELGWKPNRPKLASIIEDAWKFYQTTKRV